MSRKPLKHRGPKVSRSALVRAVASSTAIELGKSVATLEAMLACASSRYPGLKLAKK